MFCRNILIMINMLYLGYRRCTAHAVLPRSLCVGYLRLLRIFPTGPTQPQDRLAIGPIQLSNTRTHCKKRRGGLQPSDLDIPFCISIKCVVIKLFSRLTLCRLLGHFFYTWSLMELRILERLGGLTQVELRFSRYSPYGIV